MTTQQVNPLTPIHHGSAERNIEVPGYSLEPPAIYLDESHEFHVLSREGLKDWIREDTNVDRLNRVHKHLWLTGLARPARPLHEQLVLGKEIVITEKADLHLTWRDGKIYVKPLPDYLICPEAWQDFLVQDAHLYGAAVGMLWSWLWLVRTRSDFNLAHSKSLLPPHVTWTHWSTICGAVVRNIDREMLNPRYQYGELEIPRLNWLYRFCSNTTSLEHLVRGYMYGYVGYSTWFRRNTAWLAGSLVYIALVLTAMQVGMLTDRLQENASFQAVCVGFTVFAILAPLVAVSLVFLIIVVVFLFNLVDRLKHRKNHVASLPGLWEHSALKAHKH